MVTLSQSIITNVGEEYIKTYFKGKGFVQTEEKKGQALKYWIDDLLHENKINIREFEDFLFEELFWGKRKTIWIYKLDRVREYKYPVDWEKTLEDKYGIESINFSNILNMIPNSEEPRKIVAVRSEENYKGELVRIQILFACYIQIDRDSGYMDSIAYVPVEVDFVKRIMILKAWTRNKIAKEDNKAKNLLKHIERLMRMEFHVSTKDFISEHKKVLFRMSKNLIYEAYSKVPAYNQIGRVECYIKHFVDEIVAGLPLRNLENDENGNAVLNEGVMDCNAEIKNVLEGLVISDYFFDRDFTEIWDMGLEAVVARIKFNDRENVLTSLRGVDTATPIFCTKTFMALKNRMEETEKIESLWITMGRRRGNLNLKFDASDDRHLEVLIKYGIRFDATDMNAALEIYEKYESESNREITE